MLDRGLQPTVVTFSVLMNGFCMSGMLEDVTENCLVGKPKNEDTQLNLVWLSIEIFWTEIVSFGFSDLASRHSVVELELGVMSREDAGALASQKETTKATDPEGQLKTESH
ncbi:hypothetical protein L3X38_005437 [Prunus dulcis]|uniref:Uncharacterized protein n=1 Tax=Prunus dulcis TaxID=3755 RepID=A0AAD5F421_PRUDU|nr:hypothetical protein L3X38_005437 [Prunus dulcis]